jgi:hypothetical protein
VRPGDYHVGNIVWKWNDITIIGVDNSTMSSTEIKPFQSGLQTIIFHCEKTIPGAWVFGGFNLSSITLKSINFEGLLGNTRGVVHINNGNLTVIGCHFKNMSGPWFIATNSIVTIIHSSFISNHRDIPRSMVSDYGASFIAMTDCMSMIINCSFIDNSWPYAGEFGSIIYIVAPPRGNLTKGGSMVLNGVSFVNGSYGDSIMGGNGTLVSFTMTNTSAINNHHSWNVIWIAECLTCVITSSLFIGNSGMDNAGLQILLSRYVHY